MLLEKMIVLITYLFRMM